MVCVTALPCKNFVTTLFTFTAIHCFKSCPLFGNIFVNFDPNLFLKEVPLDYYLLTSNVYSYLRSVGYYCGSRLPVLFDINLGFKEYMISVDRYAARNP